MKLSFLLCNDVLEEEELQTEIEEQKEEFYDDLIDEYNFGFNFLQQCNELFCLFLERFYIIEKTKKELQEFLIEVLNITLEDSILIRKFISINKLLSENNLLYIYNPNWLNYISFFETNDEELVTKYDSSFIKLWKELILCPDNDNCFKIPTEFEFQSKIQSFKTNKIKYKNNDSYCKKKKRKLDDMSSICSVESNNNCELCGVSHLLCQFYACEM